MTQPPAGSDLSLSRPAAIGAALAVALVFFGLRLLLLAAREPFFDELFTAWIARKPWGEMLEALRSDSGPPLYYALLHLITGGGGSVGAGRALSLAASAGLLLALFRWKSGADARWIAAMILAVFPPHVYFSVEARAYALCALFAGLGAIALDRWCEEGSRRALAIGSLSFVAAAWSHYYGVLLFPIPLAIAWSAGGRRPALEGLAASLSAGLAFIPGFVLAAEQPREAIGWMAEGGAASSWDPLLGLSLAAPYPPVFVEPPPAWLQWIALALTAVVVLAGLRSRRARRWGVVVLVPVVAAIVLSSAGRLYFPMRFESVLAAPFAIWLALSLEAIRRPLIRAALLASLVGLGLISSVMVVRSAAGREPDGWRTAAALVRRTVPESVPVVASRYAWLEVVSQRDDGWSPLVVAFPPEQASHPGWAREPLAEPPLRIRREELPRAPFVWIGPATGREIEALAGGFRVEPLSVSGGVMVARVSEHGVNELEDEHRREPGEEEQTDP
ncbi:MAG TPA: hypothetical protein VMS56_08780 [Thermoanaerobaculia bacterium]|nr:hypothetical protein [Thermoanaerobaculia bacterium]